MSDEAPVDFRDLLNKPLSDFPDLPDLPGGKTFFGKLIGVEPHHSSGKGTPSLRFGVRLTDPGQDVPKAWTDQIATSGFSLADYNVYVDYWLTPNSMKMLRRFLTTLGFGEGTTFIEALKLDENGNPTAATQEAVRGLDVLCRTQVPGENGRVYNNLDQVAGAKR